MTARQLSSRLITEVQQHVATFSPRIPETDRDQLAAFAKAVLGSVDVRDLRGVAGPRLVEQFEFMLAALSQRKKNEIVVRLRYDEDADTLVIETVLEDQPFLVSTLRGALIAEHYDVRRQLNAIVRVRRDPAGKLKGVGAGDAESVMRFEVASSGNSGGRDGGGIPKGLEERIQHRLGLVQAMVRDFSPMTARLGEIADSYFATAGNHRGDSATMLRETEAMLRWIVDENFVLFAVEEYGPQGAPQAVLGTSRIRRPERNAQLIKAAAGGVKRGVRYLRSSEESPVHRAGKPGYFAMTRFSDVGEPDGVVLIEGLFTYKALHTPPEQIPVIHVALREMLDDRQVSIASDRGKNITNAFNSLPLEYLLTEERESVWELTDRILRAEAEGGSDVHIQLGEEARFAFVFVALPRWQFSEELRQNVQDLLLEELCGTYADYGVYIDRYDNAVIHFYVTGPGPLRTVDTEGLRRKVLAHARTWNDRLVEAIELVAPARADELFDVYENAFNDEHKSRCSVARIRGDVLCLETLRAGGDIDCDLYVSEFGDHPGSLNLRIFSREPINLSRELPVLSHFGFEVIDEYSRDIHIAHLPVVDMDNFRFELRPDRIGPIMQRRSNIIAALNDAFMRRVGDDDLNRLVVVSDLSAREVEILRSYVAFLNQLQVPFDSAVVRNTLVENPAVTTALMGWLAARFDPSIATEDAKRETDNALSAELQAVTDYTADRVLQAVAEVIRATRRTNAYVADRGAGEAYAFKVAPRRISFGREPKPYREIWVYHPEFEGVHLRGGKVARGGLRFSDRPDDFRTEIHGLMATQMVKNVLIVPMGAKGGFVLRHPPGDRDALRRAGDQYYQRFVRALLAVTDNVVDGVPVTPPGILLHDEGTDTYLVVAADKGTAHLSDTANSVSGEQGYWLDDAFASGGSNGYDHKKTGITARGAWEATRRCFNELGVDPESDVTTAVGVGDMSGDVFGNGLLRSRTIKLVAAFNHVHIFIDPDPDPATSFAERERLFNLPRSAWTDYSAEALSSGAGVYPRKSKEVELSEPARGLLKIPMTAKVNGDEVIRAILRLNVDLLWMGGIGTYIKAREETHAEVGDKTNDSVRVDASELRCKVLAEGANLAITDRARVEYAKGGGANYNAFLDNSGGVDLSDHEVNIKILFAPLLSAGTVTREARNVLLENCEEEVVQMVLANNRSQSRMVSFDVVRSRGDVFRYSRALNYLVPRVPFDPESYSLPAEDELANRARRGEGLYKCEAAVLCAHTKMWAYSEMLADEPLEGPIVDRFVRDYFPDRVLETAGQRAVQSHLLGREIATTMLVNRIVERAGASLFTEVATGTLKSVRDIALAWLSAADASGFEAVFAELLQHESKHQMPGIYRAMHRMQTAMEDATFYLLDQMALPVLDEEGCRQVQALLLDVDEALPEGSLNRTMQRQAALAELGVPSELAGRIVRFRYLTPVIDAVRSAPAMGRPPGEMLWLRLSVTDALNFMELNQSVDRMVYTSPWDGPSVSALRRQLNFHLHKLVRMVQGDDVQGMIERTGLQQFCGRVLELAETNPSISGLVMLDDWLRRLLPPLATISSGRALPKS